jgi:hypothetical protein
MEAIGEFLLVFVAVAGLAAGFLVIYEVSKAGDLKSVRDNKRNITWAALMVALMAALSTLGPNSFLATHC